MKTIQTISKEMQTIKEYLELFPDGEIITFNAISQNTGIIMNEQGKQYVRSALRSLKREYASIHGIGIELSSPLNATGLVNHRLIKIDNAVKRGEKTANRCMHFLSDMTEKDSKQLLLISSVFGAIRASASLAKRQYKLNNDKVINVVN